MGGFISAILEFISGLLGRQARVHPGRVPSLMLPTHVDNIDHIKEFEGFRAEAYKPTKNDVWTIGWGHTKTAKEGMVVTPEEADNLLRFDLGWVEDALNDLVNVPVTQKQFDALASLVYNIGRPNFAISTVLRKLNNSEYKEAARAFLMWNKQRNRQTGALVVLKGLTRRRSEEMEMFLDGTETTK